MSTDDVDSAGQRAERVSADSAIAQTELDALIAAFEAKEQRALHESSASPSGATPEWFDPSTETPLPIAATAAEDDTSDIDALIQRVSARAEGDRIPLVATDIDRAFAELSTAAAEEDSASLLGAEAGPSGFEHLDEDEEIAPGPADAAAAGTPESATEHVDVVLEGEPEGPAGSVEPDPMDEVLAPISESASGAPEPDEESRAEDEAAGIPAAARVLDSIAQASVIAEIGSENVAAVARAGAPPPDAIETGAPGPVAASPSPAPAVTKTAKAALAPEPAPTLEAAPAQKRNWLPPSPLTILLQQPARAAAALGAGVFVGVLAFAFLANNPLRRPELTAAGAVQDLGLAGAVRTAQALVEQHDYRAAIALLATAIAGADPAAAHYADALFLRAEAMVRSAPDPLTESAANALHAAIDNAVEAGHEDPRTGEALMWKAQVYEREGNIPAARAELRGILENYGAIPARDAVMLATAELELRTRRYEESLDAAERLVAEHPDSSLTARARIVQGDAYVARGNPKAARAVYMLAAAEHPDGAAAMAAGERLGRLAVESGQPEAAIEELERRLDTATTVEGNDAVYLVLARAYRAMGQMEKARNILNELRQFFPESEITPAALVELSEVLDGLGLHAEAGRMVDQTAQRYPSDPVVLRRAGKMLADRGQPLGAAQKFITAYDAGAREPGVLLSAAHYYLEGGLPKEAQAAYARLAEEHGGTAEAVEAQLGWARAARGLGDLEGAFTRLEEMANANEGRPGLLPVLEELADLYRELGLTGEMIETYGKVAGITNEPAPLARAARALIEAGAADEGLQLAQRVDVPRLEAPQAYGFLQAWGRTLLRGRPDEAMALLMSAHEGYPDQRTAEGIETTLGAALTLGRSAHARALVADLRGRAADRPVFERAAVQYADFLFARGDYTAADEAYGLIAPAEAATAESVAASGAATTASGARDWSVYQRANAAYALGRLAEALPRYEAVAGSASPYAGDAEARAGVIRFELRRRGEAEFTAPAEARS